MSLRKASSPYFWGDDNPDVKVSIFLVFLARGGSLSSAFYLPEHLLFSSCELVREGNFIIKNDEEKKMLTP